MADEQEYVPGDGDVEIEMEGQTLYLKPSLDACLRVSRSGMTGPLVLRDQCMALNFEAICFVIAAGLGKTIKEVEGPIYRTGTLNLFGKCVRFIHIVSNGGRPAKVEEDGEEAEADPPVSASS